MTKKKLIRLVLPFTVFVLMVVIWEVIVFWFSLPTYLVATPHQIALYAFNNIEILLKQSGITFLEAVLGFLVGSGIGVLIGALFANFRWIELSFYPYVIALKTMPVIAVAPLFIMWFGSGIFSRAAIAALICFFPAVVNTIRGLRSVEDDWLDILYSMGASNWQIFSELRLKFALPYILAALKISTTFSVIGAIVGEFIVWTNGLGYLIVYARSQRDMPAMFTGILAAALIGLLMFGVMSWIERRALYWYGSKIKADV